MGADALVRIYLAGRRVLDHLSICSYPPKTPHLEPCTYLSTVLHDRIKEHSQFALLEPQCLRYKVDELVAQFFALRKESQENLFKSRDVFLAMPLK